jgi:hypothetical protein
VAKLQGDGWLSCRKMGGEVAERRVAKLQGDGWLSCRETGG